MKISIFGASGVVGSATAFALASEGLADELILLGRRANLVRSHALDIQAALTGWNSTRVRAGIEADLTESDIVIIAAGVHLPASTPVAQKLAPNLPIITGIAGAIQKYCPGAVVINAANPVDHLNLAVYLSTSLDRHRLIGFNLNDTTRFRMALSGSLGIPAERVRGMALGEHPRSPLLVFSSVRVDGLPYAINEDLRQQVQKEIKSYLGSLEALQAGRSAGWTTALGLATLVKAIAGNTAEVLPCSAVLAGEYGFSGISLGVPVRIGRSGIQEIVELKLSDHEKAELAKIAGVLAGDAVLLRRLTGSSR